MAHIDLRNGAAAESLGPVRSGWPPAALLAVLVCFAAALTTALGVIPPWQNPDEPQHVQTVRLVLQYGGDFVLESHLNDPGERDIVESMAEYRWWEHYGEQTPNPLPTTFADGPSKLVEAYFGPPDGGSRLYYRGVAALFRSAGMTELLPQLYSMRSLSALWALLTIPCVWAGAHALLGYRSAVVVTALVALHPQFVLVSTTASPDAFVNLAGAVVWWQAAVLLTSPIRGLNVILLLAASVLGFVTRRMGATLIIITLGVVAAAVIRAATARHARLRIGWAAALAVGAVALAGTAWSAAPADVYRAVEWVRFDPVQSTSTVIAKTGDLPAFFEMLFRTFWLSAGWLQYSGPAWWQLVTVALTLVAAAGLVTAWRRGPAFARASSLAGAMILLQVSVVVAYYFGILQTGPQGRYLFPVLPAAFSLVWIGWSTIIGRGNHQPLAAASLIVVMAFLNLTAWMLVIIPAYA